MESGKWDWDRTSKKGNPVAVITVADVDGQLVSFDNRRLLAAQNAKLSSVKIQRVDLRDVKPGTNITWGESLAKRLDSRPKGGLTRPRSSFPPKEAPRSPSAYE